jgi:peroxiredoxin
MKYRTRVMAWILIVVFLGALWPLGASGARPEACDAHPKSANLNFTLKDIRGNDIALSAYRGDVILLDFWATWCAPCKLEIPGFVELYNKYRSRGFVVLGVSVDDPVSDLRPFVARFKMDYPVLVGAHRDDLKSAFGPLVGFPTSFLIARDGTICTEHVGYAPQTEFLREINELLAAPKESTTPQR